VIISTLIALVCLIAGKSWSACLFGRKEIVFLNLFSICDEIMLLRTVLTLAKCDQIGRIFAQWVIVCLGQLHEN
jgi:hypothetical protein